MTTTQETGPAPTPADPTHPYFTAKARAVLTAAGGDPQLAGPLAAWAAQARELARSDTRAERLGVVVADDGELLAETRRSRDRVTASYVIGVTHDRDHDAVNTEVGLALGQLRRSSGRQVITVTYSQVCMGPGEGR